VAVLTEDSSVPPPPPAEIPDTIAVSSSTDWQAAFGFTSNTESHDDDLGEWRQRVTETPTTRTLVSVRELSYITRQLYSRIILTLQCQLRTYAIVMFTIG